MRRLVALAVVSLLVAACGSSTASGSPVASAGEPTTAAATGSVASGSPAASGIPEASSGPAASDAAGASTAPDASAAADASTAPVASAPAASQSSACAKLNDAIGTIDLYMQLLSQVDASNWSDLTGSSSPVGFKLAKLATAITVVAAYPDTRELATNVQEVLRLASIALRDPAPFAADSTAGSMLTDGVLKLFVPVGVAMTQLREKQGCPVQ